MQAGGQTAKLSRWSALRNGLAPQAPSSKPRAEALLETSQECDSTTVAADRSGRCPGQLRSQAR
jgi:hypothetical protein